MGKYLAALLERDINTLSFAELNSPVIKARIKDIVFVTATDGNHGRGVAWAAEQLGLRAVVYMPKGSSPAVSYTHLTLPTIYSGEISGGAGALKKKKNNQKKHK